MIPGEEENSLLDTLVINAVSYKHNSYQFQPESMNKVVMVTGANR